jgi:IclR family transcriptional regulator, acetate operon repressor
MRSVRTALSVFEAVAEHQPVGLSALARHLDLPKATVQRSLSTLAEAGWLVQDLLDPGRWMVSARFAVLADASPVAQAVRAAARAPLADLRDQTGETVGLFTIDGDHMEMLDGIEGTHLVRAVARSGPLPIHVSAAGRAMLACLPADQRRAAVERLARVRPADGGGNGKALPRYTDRSALDVASLLVHIAEAERTGYAVVDGEYVPDVCGIGAAIRRSGGAPAAGIALLGPSHRLTPDALVPIGRQVADCAAQISAALA